MNNKHETTLSFLVFVWDYDRVSTDVVVSRGVGVDEVELPMPMW